MSSTSYTRDQILLMREGYARATRFQGMSREFAERQAALTYPLPAITRPRVITLSNGGLRKLEGGVIWYAQNRTTKNRESIIWHPTTMTPDDAMAMADLVRHPTETVPGE